MRSTMVPRGGSTPNSPLTELVAEMTDLDRSESCYIELFPIILDAIPIGFWLSLFAGLVARSKVIFYG